MHFPLGSIQPAMLPTHQHAIDRALRSNAGAQKGIGARSEPLLIKRRSNVKQEKEQWTKTPELDAGPSIARTGCLVGYCFPFSIDFVTFGFSMQGHPSLWIRTRAERQSSSDSQQAAPQLAHHMFEASLAPSLL